MGYILGSSIEKASEKGLETFLSNVGDAVVERYDGKAVVVSTSMDSVILVNEDGNGMRVSVDLDADGKVVLGEEKAYKAISAISDDRVPSFVSESLRGIATSILEGKPVKRTQVREVMDLVGKDEHYWVSDILDGMNESISSSTWGDVYSANMDRIRTSLYGNIRNIESKVPKARYTKLPEGKLSGFVGELSDSMEIVSEVYSDVAGKCAGMSFGDDFNKGVCESLVAEAQVNGDLLGKAARLMRDDNMSQVAEAHDKMADRARTMVLMSEYLASKSSNKE